MIQLTRRYRFCASHRLHSPDLSDQANRKTYGKCNNPHGHGHDYTLEVTVAGPLDPVTGGVVRVAELDRLVSERILEELDHRNLNEEVPGFAHVVPTTENLALEIRKRLDASWEQAFGGAGPALARIRVHETKRNIFETSEEI